MTERYRIKGVYHTKLSKTPINFYFNLAASNEDEARELAVAKLTQSGADFKIEEVSLAGTSHENRYST
jgi:hypothetical protein